jgi:hypothetical protein
MNVSTGGKWNDSVHTPAAYPQQEHFVPLDRRVRNTAGLDMVGIEKNSSCARYQISLSSSPYPSHYTDWAIPAHTYTVDGSN